MLEVADYLKLD